MGNPVRAVSSRSFEGLAVSILGGTAGAIGGAAAYTPDTPREWLDEYGQVRSRKLTREEKKNRILAAAAAGLGGALLGSGLSLGASGVMRSSVTGAEREAAKSVADEYLGPLKELVSDWNRLYNGLPNKNNSIAEGMAKRVRAGRTILHEEQERVTNDLVDLAASRRAEMPFGGPEVLLPGGKAGRGAYDEATHRGIAKKHFDAMAKKYGPGSPEELNFENAYDVFSNAASARMTKMSAAAMIRVEAPPSRTLAIARPRSPKEATTVGIMPQTAIPMKRETTSRPASTTTFEHASEMDAEPAGHERDLTTRTAGFAAHVARRAGLGEVVGVDLSAQRLRTARRAGAASLVCADAVRLPLGDGPFHPVLASELAEPVRDDRRSLPAVHRCVRLRRLAAGRVPPA